MQATSDGHFGTGELAPFTRLSSVTWKISERVALPRRAVLLQSPPYAQLVQELVAQSKLDKVARERSRDAPDFFRAVVTLEVSSSVLDLFYNSASGYRAQYYEDAALGARANRYALDRLLPHVINLLACYPSRTCPSSWVEKSLQDGSAKLWPRQGLWLRHAKTTDQNLLVARWTNRLLDPDKQPRYRARRSTLMPADETRLELKGGFLSLAGLSLGTLKPERSKDIHELGYT